MSKAPSKKPNTPKKGQQSMGPPNTPNTQNRSGLRQSTLPLVRQHQLQQQQQGSSIVTRTRQRSESGITFNGRYFSTIMDLVNGLLDKSNSEEMIVSLSETQFSKWAEEGELYDRSVANIFDALHQHPRWASIQKRMSKAILARIQPMVQRGRSANQRAATNAEKCRNYIGSRWYDWFYRGLGSTATFSDALWEYVKWSNKNGLSWFQAQERLSRAHTNRLLTYRKGWSANPALCAADINRARDGSLSNDDIGHLATPQELQHIQQRLQDAGEPSVYQDRFGFLHHQPISDVILIKNMVNEVPQPDGPQVLPGKPGKADLPSGKKDLTPAAGTGRAWTPTPSPGKKPQPEIEQGNKRTAGKDPRPGKKPKYVLEEAVKGLADNVSNLSIDETVKDVTSRYFETKKPGSTGGSPTPLSSGLQQDFSNIIIPNATPMDSAIIKWGESILTNLMNPNSEVFDLFHCEAYRHATPQQFDESIRKLEKVVFGARQAGGKLNPLPEKGVFQYATFFIILRTLSASQNRQDAPWIANLRTQIARVFATAAVPADFNVEVATDQQGSIRMQYSFFDINRLAYDGVRYDDGWLGTNLIRETIRYYLRDRRDAQTIDSDDLHDYASRRNFAGNQVPCPEFHRDARTIYVPLNTGGHWILVVIQLDRKTIEVFNSLSGSETESIGDQIQALLVSNGYDYLSFKLRFQLCPQQTNTADCGFWTIQNALSYSFNGHAAPNRTSQQLRTGLTNSIVGILLNHFGVDSRAPIVTSPSDNLLPTTSLAPKSASPAVVKPSIEKEDPFVVSSTKQSNAKRTGQKQQAKITGYAKQNPKSPDSVYDVNQIAATPTPVSLRPPLRLSVPGLRNQAQVKKEEPAEGRYDMRTRKGKEKK